MAPIIDRARSRRHKWVAHAVRKTPTGYAVYRVTMGDKHDGKLVSEHPTEAAAERAARELNGTEQDNA